MPGTTGRQRLGADFMAIRVREDYRGLTGPEKAAILMLSLGDDVASKLFSLMGDDEIKELSQTMANLGSVSSSIVERLFVEFAEQISSTGSLVGTFDSTERLLTKVLPKDKVDSIMEDIRGPAGRTMWDKLANVNEQVLANYLKNEYPQTVAVVLSKIKPDHASRVLTLLPESFAMEVIMRILRMESVQKEVLDDIERTLRTEFMSNLARTNRRDAHEMMAEMFNSLDRNTEARFIAALEERNRDSAERIRALMFTFEDLGKLDPSGIQTLLRTVDKQKLTIGLKGASETLKDLFFTNMSERAAKIMREDMGSLGPIRLKDVDEAQMYMVQLAKDMASRGEIVIASGKGEDELIY
jgi:flagellar motor switch protein FliG